MAKKKAAHLLSKLAEIQQDLLSHIQDGYKLEAGSLGGNPVLRPLKDNEEKRPLSASRKLGLCSVLVLASSSGVELPIYAKRQF